jgi:spermidine synthase
MPRARARVRPVVGPGLLPAWMVACFLCSGAAGLLYEVVWGKELSYLLGGSLRSVATVVAAFLGGLALGARVLGARLARRPALARTYAMLEVGVALLGLLMLPLLRSLDGPIGLLYRALGAESPAFAIARVVLLLLLMVPPAALMGATLPVLVARCEHGLLGSGLAQLYAINTLGAVAGSVLGGFYLLPAHGLLATTFVAAALNLAAAGIAWRAAAPEPAEASPRAGPGQPPEPPLPDGARAVFAVLFAFSGFSALLLQLAWVRLFGLILGSSVYSFSSVLGIYLLGIAAGSALIAPVLARGRAAPWGFALLELGLALTSVAGIFAYAALPRAMLELGERAGSSWGGLLVGELALVASLLFVPCVLLGAVFPLAARLLQRVASGPTSGFAYAVNTAGTIAGSLVAGFFLLPAIGVQGVVLLAAALCVLVAAVAVTLPGIARTRPRPLVAAAVLCAATVALAIGAPRWQPALMSLGTYRPNSAQHLLQSFRASGGSGDPTRALAASQHVLFYRDGINASVLVVSDQDRRRLWMRVGGKVDAGTEDMLTQVLLGLIPAVMADSGARALVVGHGSGVTAASALAAGVGATDIVELEPAVVTGSRFFHEQREDPLDDPRVTLHLEDARTLLAHGGGTYDLVISEPSNPWVAGVNNLFTVDFYRQVRARLRPDGVFCQWLQLYELSPRTFESLLASYLEVFPEAHLFCNWDSADAILVAAPASRGLTLERLRSPRLAFAYQRARLSSPEQLAAFYVASGPVLRAMAAGGELNTDDRPFVEYQAPRDMIEVGRGYSSHHPGVTAAFGLLVLPPPGNPMSGWPRETVVEARARRRLASADAAGAAGVLAEVSAAGLEPLATRLAGERALPAIPVASSDALAEARGRLARGDADGAAAIARHALDGSTGLARLEPLLVLGIAEFGARRESAALASFQKAQAVAPHDPRAYQFEARIRLSSADEKGARAALARGLAHAPGDSLLSAALRALDRVTTPR